MQSVLDLKQYSQPQIDSIYKNTQMNIEKITSAYLKEVDLGKSEKNFKKWNQYVNNELGIDNIQLVENTLKKNEKNNK
jgi:hypothetical protein